MWGRALRFWVWCCCECAVSLLCSQHIAVVAAAKKELNNCVCVCLAVSGWSTVSCCIIIVCCPSPLTSHSSNCGQREREEEEGVRGRKGEGGRMNESLNELYCVRPCLHFVGLGYASVLYSNYSVCRPTCMFPEQLFQRVSL